LRAPGAGGGSNGGGTGPAERPVTEPFDTLRLDVSTADLQGETGTFEAILKAARQKYVSIVVDVAGRGGDPLYLRFVPLVGAGVSARSGGGGPTIAGDGSRWRAWPRWSGIRADASPAAS